MRILQWLLLTFVRPLTHSLTKLSWAYCDRKGVPDPLLKYFQSYFSSSRLLIGRDLIHPAHRGVKQGDPLSPWLFNIAMDRILEGQEEYAFSISALVLNQMAHADDLILFASSPDKLQKCIDRLLVGLGLNSMP